MVASSRQCYIGSSINVGVPPMPCLEITTMVGCPSNAPIVRRTSCAAPTARTRSIFRLRTQADPGEGSALCPHRFFRHGGALAQSRWPPGAYFRWFKVEYLYVDLGSQQMFNVVPGLRIPLRRNLTTLKTDPGQVPGFCLTGRLCVHRYRSDRRSQGRP